MKKTALLLASVFVLTAGVASLAHGQGLTLQRDIVVGSGETQENVVLLGGSARVDGTVRQSVVALGGNVVISGTVEDSVVGIGASITLKATAVVKKDVVAIGGKLIREPGASVGNDTVFFDLSRLVPGFMKGGAKGFFSLSIVPLLLILKLVTAFIWFLMAIVVAGIFPKQVAFASNQVRTSFGAIFGTGFLGFIVFTGLIIISAFLCLILIGIPILLTVAVGAMCLRVFGQVALFHFFGQSLSRSFGKPNPSVLGASLLGLLLVSVVGFIPVLGLLFSFMLSILGFGVAIRTKFGTAENWFARKQAQAPAPPQA
jgi:hypothetical protein